jgi:putative DNA primase/helicase
MEMLTNGHHAAHETRGRTIDLKPNARAAIERLAELSTLEYEQCREDEAETLKVRVSILDAEVIKRRKSAAAKPAGAFLEAPEPWPEPVDGTELIGEIAETIGRYVILPDHGASAIALWVVAAHALDCFEIFPILAIESPEKRCGKTTLLSAIQWLVPKPLLAANMTLATVFRAIEEFGPTLVIDEAETFISADNPELVGVLNSGHNRALAYVLRLVGDAHELKQFRTWCAKVMALIGVLPPTLQDRAIAVRLRRRKQGETVERLRGDKADDLKNLCRRAAKWASDHADELRAQDPNVPRRLHDRAADNWRPLLAVAQTVGGAWPAIARKAAHVISGKNDDEETGGVRLLADCREILPEWLTPTTLVEKLIALPEAPWAEWRHGKPITTTGVARLLKPFGIKSEQDREGGAKARRFYRDAFADAWARYLPPYPGEQAGHLGRP